MANREESCPRVRPPANMGGEGGELPQGRGKGQTGRELPQGRGRGQTGEGVAQGRDKGQTAAEGHGILWLLSALLACCGISFDEVPHL